MLPTAPLRYAGTQQYTGLSSYDGVLVPLAGTFRYDGTQRYNGQSFYDGVLLGLLTGGGGGSGGTQRWESVPFVAAQPPEVDPGEERVAVLLALHPWL